MDFVHLTRVQINYLLLQMKYLKVLIVIYLSKLGQFSKIYPKHLTRFWHEGLLYKLKSMGISGELYNLLENYLLGRFQKVFLN